MSETASYTSDGHQFPQSCDLPPLPRVVQFEQVPGGGQPTIEATYSYTSNNFVGGFSGASCDADSDNLYGVSTGYTYGSTESRTCQGDTRTITRTYDSYHLLVDETTAQNGSSLQVHTDYYARIGESFDEQPAQFQLPAQHTVTWTDATRSARSEVTTTSFDEQGNPRSQTDPVGRRTDWTFYPVGGSGSDCPPDPNGFTRWLRDVTRTPPATEFDAPVLRVSYQYTAYATPDPQVNTVVLKSTEKRFAGDQALSSVDFHYITSGDEFSRIQKLDSLETLGGDGGNPFVTVGSTHTFSFSVDGEALSQTHTLATDTGLTVRWSEKCSRFTGRLWSATDTQDDRMTAAYDGLGRVLSRIVNPGTSYQAEETYTYELGGSAPFVVTSASPMMSTDANEPGDQIRVSFDGAGRPLQRERKAVDGDGGWHVIQRTTYDEQGRTSSITNLDHLPDGSKGAELAETFVYDDWGQVSATERTDGSTRVTRTDPIALTSTTRLDGNGSPVTGTTVTICNLRGEPVRAQRFDLRGVSRGSRTLDRDGWGRVRRETDEAGNTIHYDYNPRGLLTLTALPDGTRVSHAYDVPRDAGGLATELTVGDAVHGKQTFDELGRLVDTSSGGRTWHYEYARDSDVIPTGATMPDGQRRGYTVVPQLDNTLSQVQADPIVQDLTPHPVTGFPTEAREGDVTITRGYYPSGLPRTETVTRSGQPDTTATWQFTLGGNECGYAGVDGATRRTARDQLGRFKEITDPDLQVLQPTYDSASRLTGWTVKDLRSGFTLATALTLDDFGREVERDFTYLAPNSGGAEVWKQTQEWHRGPRPRRRHRRHGHRRGGRRPRSPQRGLRHHTRRRLPGRRLGRHRHRQRRPRKGLAQGLVHPRLGLAGHRPGRPGRSRTHPRARRHRTRHTRPGNRGRSHPRPRDLPRP
ncbi:RHS repeat protein [Frankia sp. AiPa1]|uniref:RHS repeat protein n=1 Tax=Frankia sp. AiPa1 TaxID=573492 RepID=UPI00202B7BFB|nr:RHS repeat protein [Frankia sp. AiPa1]MCL9759478.1 RHS repeat protein [Frankia sp. AiPa1]